ncbi:MAG: PDGLE domain-containing protein [Anaerolineaceae bacterium]|nr:PDGLE domain-containing protein [Anaerolineaceae bacterium]
MLYSPVSMHIPDGFLSTIVSVLFWAVSIIFIISAIQKTKQQLDDKQVPLMGILAAAIFAGQMLNFSVTGGTSGHLLGAALATILLGPWAAILVMTTVVSVQAIVFQDGGLLALGTNIFNMAVIGVFVAYVVYTLVTKFFTKKQLGTFVAGFLAAWSSIFVASLACGLQLALSGTSPANIAIPAMGGIHALIGIGEGLITLGALLFLASTRKDLLSPNSVKQGSNTVILVGGTVIIIALAILSPLASSHPDGLEWVAEESGFLSAAQDAFFEIIPDYVMPGISNEAIATIIAGIIGAVVVFAVAYGTASSRKKESKEVK